MNAEPEPDRADNVRAIAQAQLERLDADLRVLSPVGIERVAWGWDRQLAGDVQVSERIALHAIETAGDGQGWDAWRQRLFSEVEGRQALVAWQAEHQLHAPHVHKAERAAMAGALGVFAQAHISHAHYSRLVSALAEALPWLLPERPPDPN